MASWWDIITTWWKERQDTASVISRLQSTFSLAELNALWDSLPAETRNAAAVQQAYVQHRKRLSVYGDDLQTRFGTFVGGALDEWLKVVQKYETKDPEQAKKNLALMTTDIMKVAGAAAAIDLGLGMLPNGAGPASSANTKQLLAWLGFGAVLTAVAHDPVKIGLLRPYQDSLEQTFRNRRPDDFALFQAYRTRELSPIKVEDLSKLNDAEMTRIETDNQTYYDREIAKWGYSEWFATALSRSATRTLNFSQLVTLARAGIYDRGLVIYSLWGEGLDRVVMPAALTAIETLRDREMYSGFRSMIEPSFVEGDISEADLKAYWTLSGIPEKVQTWVLPRLRKRSEAYALKQKTGAAVKERDLTVSQVQQAYQNNLQDRAHAQNMIIALGYSLNETKILLDLAELRRKLPSAQTLKRLPLSDYEKAYKNGILKSSDVLDRMRGEYTAADIDIEKKLLEVGKA